MIRLELTKDECRKLLSVLAGAGHCSQDDDGVVYTVSKVASDCELCSVVRKVAGAMRCKEVN